MNIREIVETHLKSVGAEGLCLDECGCRMLDLMPCGGGWEDCVPAVRMKCDDDCDRCEGSGCMVPMPENRGIRRLHHPLARSMMNDIVELLEKRIANKGQYLSETAEDARHDLEILAEGRLYSLKDPKP
jgi:hypothetical protein